MSPIDLINHLTINKTPWEKLSESEQKGVGIFMLNRWLSMSDDLLEIVDELQTTTLRLTSKQAYKFYLDILPNTKIYIKYVKSKKQDKYPKELIKVALDFFKLSQREVENYLGFLTIDEIDNLLRFYGKTDKERKKIIKDIK